MKITPKWNFCEGSFDTKETKMLCLPYDKHGVIQLCIKDNEGGWNFPIANIKLHSRDLYVDFEETYDNAVALGTEIARRWNECETKL